MDQSSPGQAKPMPSPTQNVPKAQPMVRPIAQQAREPERHGRLTINSLIHKMTGQVGREQPAPRRTAEPDPSPRAAHVGEPAYEDNERERVDIPAFLRRQAN